MKLQFRYTDPNYTFIPVPRVRQRVVLPDDLDRGPLEHKRIHPIHDPLPHTPYEGHEYPTPSHTHKPYSWEERREGVMKRMPNVLNWVQPIGSTVPYQKLLTDGDESRELAWLIKTQHMDLAPQWQEFAANGLHAASLHNAPEGSDEADIADQEHDYSLALAEMYDNGRREQWAMERDYQTWHTSPARRANVKYDAQKDKYSAKTRWGSEFTRDELLGFIRNARAHGEDPDPRFAPITRAWSDCLDWLDALDRDPKRDEFRIADEQARYDEDRVGYAAGEPCPMMDVILADVPQCKDGLTPIFDMPQGMFGPIEVIDYAECQTCFGTSQVQNVLGTSLAVTDDE